MSDKFYKKTKIEIADFISSIERLSNAIMILNTFYDLCFQDYDEFWRINGLIQAVMVEHDAVMEEAQNVRELFLD